MPKKCGQKFPPPPEILDPVCLWTKNNTYMLRIFVQPPFKLAKPPLSPPPHPYDPGAATVDDAPLFISRSERDGGRGGGGVEKIYS